MKFFNYTCDLLRVGGYILVFASLISTASASEKIRESFSFSNINSNGPQGEAENVTVTRSATGGKPINRIRLRGTLTETIPSTFINEARIRISVAGQEFVASFSGEDYIGSVDLEVEFAVNNHFDAAGSTAFEFFESFDDGAGADQVWETLTIEFITSSVIHTGGASALVTPPVDAFSSDADTPAFRAVEFTLGTGGLAQGITFEGTYASAQTLGTDEFTVAIFDDNGVDTDLPGNLLVGPIPIQVVSRTDTGVDEFGLDVFRYQGNLESSVTLNPGNYWISIVNDTSSDPDDDWRWTAASSSANSPITVFSTQSRTGGFQPRTRGDLVFSIDSDAFLSAGQGIRISRITDDTLAVSFEGILQRSTDLKDWETLDPQPDSPLIIENPVDKAFFRTQRP